MKTPLNYSKGPELAQVLENLENPGILFWPFSMTGKSWKKTTGPGKVLEICLTQARKFSEPTL